MDNRVNYALVGFFVIILSMALLAIILWITVKPQEAEYKTYVVYMTESVAGLNVNAQVKYKGVDVGFVKSIDLAPERVDVVRLLLEIEEITPLRADASATLSSQGLTGLAYVELEGGSSDEPLADAYPYPEITAKPSFLVRLDKAISEILEDADGITQQVEELLGNLNNLTMQAQQVLSPENQQYVQHTLQQVSNLSERVTQQSDTLLQSIQKTVDNSAVASEDLPELLDEVQKTLAQFTETADSVDQVINSNRQNLQVLLSQSGQFVQQVSGDAERFSNEVIPRLGSVLGEMYAVMRNLNQFSQDLQQKPDMLLFGKPAPAPGPGE